MTTTRTALAKAKRGAAFLDEQLRRGWRRKIRRRELDMGSGIYSRGECGCVLAQLYDDYTVGLEELGINAVEEKRLGFNSSCRARYSELTEAWLEVLRGHS